MKTKKPKSLIVLLASSFAISGLIAAVAQSCAPSAPRITNENRVTLQTAINELQNYDITTAPNETLSTSAVNLLNSLESSTIVGGQNLTPTSVRTISYLSNNVSLVSDGSSFSVIFDNQNNSNSVIEVLTFVNTTGQVVTYSSNDDYQITNIVFSQVNGEIISSTWSAFDNTIQENATFQSTVFFTFQILSTYSAARQNGRFLPEVNVLIENLRNASNIFGFVPASINSMSFRVTSVLLFSLQNQSAGFYVGVLNESSQNTFITITYLRNTGDTVLQTIEIPMLYLINIVENPVPATDESVITSGTWTTTSPV